jgi:hypothetical protein
MDLNEMTVRIIERMEKHLDDNYMVEVTLPDEIKEFIHEAADKCRQTELYINTKNDVPDDFKTGKAIDLYMHMVVKIANAPTFLHAVGTLRLMLPLISDAIKREEQEVSYGRDKRCFRSKGIPRRGEKKF